MSRVHVRIWLYTSIRDILCVFYPILPHLSLGYIIILVFLHVFAGNFHCLSELFYMPHNLLPIEFWNISKGRRYAYGITIMPRNGEHIHSVLLGNYIVINTTETTICSSWRESICNSLWKKKWIVNYSSWSANNLYKRWFQLYPCTINKLSMLTKQPYAVCNIDHNTSWYDTLCNSLWKKFE